MNKFSFPVLGTAALVCGFLLASVNVSAQASPKMGTMKMGGTPAKASNAAKKTVYTCTMHPEVLSMKAGKCPKCKMPLTKKSVAAVYTCSMHPEVLSLKPGKCPKCKMPLTKMK